MGVYATVEQVRAELEDLGPRAKLPPEGDDDALERLIARAELDIDRIVGGAYDPEVDRKLTPDQLTAAQRAALVRAVAAQVAFRTCSPERDLYRPENRLRAAGDLSFVDRPIQRISDVAVEHLAGRGLLRATRTVAAPSDPSPATLTP